MNAIIDYIKKLTEKHTELEGQTMPEGLLVRGFADAKKVTKPWGFELWLSDASDTPYALKIIYFKQGAKSSLQLHNEKSEHNCIVVGTMKLHYEDPNTKNIVQLTLGPGHFIKVLPKTIHRVEAVTDVIVFEASSHHLDDVIRLKDDYNRPDGKINTEHSH